MLERVMTALKTLNGLLDEEHEQFEYLYNLFILTILLEPKRVLELGTARGLSTRAILAGLQFNGQGHLVTVDVDGREQEIARKKIEELGLPALVTFFTNDDLKIKCIWKMDLVFIDTSHTYEHTLAELRRFSPWTSLIVLHDTRVREGVRSAVDAFLAENEKWSFCEVGSKTNYGLGILSKTTP